MESSSLLAVGPIITILIIVALWSVVSKDSFGNYTLNWNLFMYYIVDILVIATIVSWLMSRNQPIAAGLTCLLLILVFYFYYLKFFKNAPGDAHTASTPSTTSAVSQCGDGAVPEVPPCSNWPPIVNMCPDFMVVWKSPEREVYCYDYNNTYNLQTATGLGLTTNLNINGLTGQSAFLQKDLVSKLKNNPGEFANNGKGRYLTWEGVWQASPSPQSANSTANAPKPSS